MTPAPRRQTGGKRAKKTRDARTGRFATITLILDRGKNNVEWELMGLSTPEAYGIVVLAERLMSEAISEGVAISGTSTADEWADDDVEDEDEED